MVHPHALSAKVAAMNNAHAYALKLHPVLAEFFRPYIGQKIEKADGTLLKKIQDAMPQFPDSGLDQYRLHTYRNTSGYTLAWGVKACELSPSRNGDYQHANYYEVTACIGNMRNGVLESLQDAPTLRTDYTVEEVQQKRQAFEKARKSYEEARSALYPFDEYDR